MLTKILVGTDGSETAAKAVTRAGEIAADTGAELLVFTAFQKPKGLASARKLVLPQVRELKKMKVNVRPLIREGPPAEAILDVADEEAVDLIVVGNKGITGARRFFLGSVPSNVSHNAACNVLIVKTT